MRRAFVALTTAAVCLAAAQSASGQVLVRRDAPRAGSWELGGGITWTRGFSGTDRPAELTRNGELKGGFDLFKSRGKISGGVGVAATLGVYLSRAVAVEAGMRFAKPRLTIRLSGDVEDAQPVSADETLTRYVFTGSVILHLRQLTFARRAVPFVAAGAGHIRELHEGSELIETGAEYHVLGGIKYWFGNTRRRFGIRGQAGMSVSDGGFDFKDEPRLLTIASAGLVYLF